MDLKAAASLLNVKPKSSRHSLPGSPSRPRSPVRMPRSSGGSPPPGAKTGSASDPPSRGGRNTPTRRRPRSERGLHHWRHQGRPSPASAAASPSKPAVATSVSTTSAPPAVYTSQYPEEGESPGRGTPSSSPLVTAASTVSSLLQTQRVRLQRRRWPAASSRALALLALSVGVACALAVVYYFYRSAPSGALQGRGALATRACVTAGCREHASFFRRNLNTRRDPCVDLDGYVCSLWSPSSPMASDLAGQMTLTWALRATESLTQDATSEALDAGGALGAQHKVVSAFLHKCIAQKDDDPRSLNSVRKFAADLGIPWPYDANHPSERGPHPFEVVIRLDVLWGLKMWCQTAVLKRRRQKPIPPMLVVRRTDMASAWLGLVDALDNNQGRRAYYNDIHSLYGVPVPDAATADRHLETEREMLTALASVANETGREAVDTTVGRLEPLFGHSDGIPLVRFLLSFFNASGIHERSRVYVESRRFVVALDELLGKFGRDRLMEHIAWWFAQLCAVMASSKARRLIGGNEVESEALKKTNCFDVAEAWFGPTLYGSVAHVTAADERRAVDDFLRALLGDVHRAVAAISWTDETTRRAMVKRLREMSVVTSQEPEEASRAALSEVWSNSTKLLLALGCTSLFLSPDCSDRHGVPGSAHGVADRKLPALQEYVRRMAYTLQRETTTGEKLLRARSAATEINDVTTGAANLAPECMKNLCAQSKVQ
ncbi:uncharacterized protein [Dermacentor albipictus]|uniref:uncharacterized protein isoform X2 n=1 Tax=Dermacentor albipictus TaxID=60249 RepID=UPI0038FC4916